MKAVTVDPDPRLSAWTGGSAGWRYAARAPAPVPADALAWARACFEGAPRPMRLFLVSGWWGLVLEGGPTSDATHVLGWPVAQVTSQTAVLQRRSRLGIQATLLFATQRDTVTFSSAIVCSNRLGRMVWAVVAPVHRCAARAVLSHASTVTRR